MIDARRLEVYSALYSTELDEVRKIKADIVEAGSYLEYLDKSYVAFFGNGSDKCRDIIHHPNAIFIPGVETSASSMIQFAESAWQKQDFVDMAYFEPFYLKDFIATIPKNKLLPPQNNS